MYERMQMTIEERVASPWRPAAAGQVGDALIEAAREVGSRLRREDQVERAVRAAEQQSNFGHIIRWQPHVMAQGYAGLALLCSQLDRCFPDEDWDTVGHEHLSRAADDAQQRPGVTIGLFSGLSGLAFAAWSLSRDGQRYRKLLSALDQVILPQTASMAAGMMQTRQAIPTGQYDVISGLSGVGAYLLCRRAEPEPRAVLQLILRSLISLTEEVDGLPRWYTPPHFLMEESMRQAYPYGNLNCGLAHGIPGPVALLSLALLSGIDVEGAAEAIDRSVRWLAHQTLEDEWGINWPSVVPLKGPAGSPPAPPPYPARAAWCYGTPGVARSIWLAGEVLGRDSYRELAVEAMAAVYRRPVEQRFIDSPTFCHGVSGLLHITLRFARDTGLPLFQEATERLAAQLLAQYEPASLLGYRSIEVGDRHVDQPGLLDGAPGVALVLLAAATAHEPVWDRLFLMS